MAGLKSKTLPLFEHYRVKIWILTLPYKSSFVKIFLFQFKKKKDKKKLRYVSACKDMTEMSTIKVLIERIVG